MDRRRGLENLYYFVWGFFTHKSAVCILFYLFLGNWCPSFVIPKKRSPVQPLGMLRLCALFHFLLWSSWIELTGSILSLLLCVSHAAPRCPCPGPQPGHSSAAAGGAFCSLISAPLGARDGAAAGKLLLCCVFLVCHLHATLALPFLGDISGQQLQSRYVHLMPYCIQGSSQTWCSEVALTLT